ncbi:MAG: hypothetical protein R3C16_13000 [Hyphomonadaceae bacterium]
MRPLALLAALALVAAPVVALPSVAYADGIERPRQPRPRPRPRPAPAPTPAPPVVVEEGPEVVTLSNSFFAGSSGGVGADVGVGYYSSSTVVVRGTGASASAFAYASARASAGARGGFRGGHRGGGCGCR